MVVWEGPLVGTPVCCTGFGCKGCKGRAKGWVGMLNPVTGVWFCFLPSALKQNKVIDNSKQKLEHHRLFKSFFSPVIHKLAKNISQHDTSLIFSFCKQNCRKFIQFPSLSSSQSFFSPYSITFHSIIMKSAYFSIIWKPEFNGPPCQRL